MAQIKRMEIGLNERKKNLHHVYWFDAYKIAVICAFFILLPYCQDIALLLIIVCFFPPNVCEILWMEHYE